MLGYLIGFGLLKMVVSFIFWLIIIILAINLFRRLRHSVPMGSPARQDVIEILRQRYAHGEIDTEEFQRRKEELNK
jgi:putative membrane protein